MKQSKQENPKKTVKLNESVSVGAKGPSFSFSFNREIDKVDQKKLITGNEIWY